jgi:hypothetical protein
LVFPVQSPSSGSNFPLWRKNFDFLELVPKSNDGFCHNLHRKRRIVAACTEKIANCDGLTMSCGIITALTHVVRSVYPRDRRAQAFRDLCAMMIENYDKVYAPRPEFSPADGGLQ